MSINVDFKGCEIGGLPALTTATFVAGRAVYMASSGYVTVPIAASRCLGLVKEDIISGVSDQVSGQYGIYGSKKCTVLARGVATVGQSVYNGTSYSAYNEALTYTAGDEIYATATTGVLTNVQPAATGPSGLTSLRVGRVLVAPTNPANGDPMQITVECA